MRLRQANDGIADRVYRAIYALNYTSFLILNPCLQGEVFDFELVKQYVLTGSGEGMVAWQSRSFIGVREATGEPTHAMATPKWSCGAEGSCPETV